jgi:hypothetical protein
VQARNETSHRFPEDGGTASINYPDGFDHGLILNLGAEVGRYGDSLLIGRRSDLPEILAT